MDLSNMHLYRPNGSRQTVDIAIYSIGVLESCKGSRVVAILESNH